MCVCVCVPRAMKLNSLCSERDFGGPAGLPPSSPPFPPPWKSTGGHGNVGRGRVYVFPPLFPDMLGRGEGGSHWRQEPGGPAKSAAPSPPFSRATDSRSHQPGRDPRGWLAACLDLSLLLLFKKLFLVLVKLVDVKAQVNGDSGKSGVKRGFVGSPRRLQFSMRLAEKKNKNKKTKDRGGERASPPCPQHPTHGRRDEGGDPGIVKFLQDGRPG